MIDESKTFLSTQRLFHDSETFLSTKTMFDGRKTFLSTKTVFYVSKTVLSIQGCDNLLTWLKHVKNSASAVDMWWGFLKSLQQTISVRRTCSCDQDLLMCIRTFYAYKTVLLTCNLVFLMYQAVFHRKLSLGS